MYRSESHWIDGPIKARHEPPTLEEAVAAAESVTDKPDEQEAFAAGLMGVPVDEVRAFVQTRARRRIRVASVERTTARGAVVVERKVRRSVRAG